MNDQSPIFGSSQLRRYLDARQTMERAAAAELVGMSLEEARLTDIANEKGQIDLPPWPLRILPRAVDPKAAAAELARLVKIFEHCDRRHHRAREREVRAAEESDAAWQALRAASQALDEFKAANPAPQLELI